MSAVTLAVVPSQLVLLVAGRYSDVGPIVPCFLSRAHPWLWGGEQVSRVTLSFLARARGPQMRHDYKRARDGTPKAEGVPARTHVLLSHLSGRRPLPAPTPHAMSIAPCSRTGCYQYCSAGRGGVRLGTLLVICFSPDDCCHDLVQ